MSEYVSTDKACAMLRISRKRTWHLSANLKIRWKKNLNKKLWCLDDIIKILDYRKAKSYPPDGWIKLDEAALILGWSPRVTRSILLGQGLKPERFNLWGKQNCFYPAACWNEKAVKEIAREFSKRKRTIPPEGWLTFADCMDYLDMNKQRTQYWLRNGNVAFQKLKANRYYYAEDDVVALRKRIRNPITPATKQSHEPSS